MPGKNDMNDKQANRIVTLAAQLTGRFVRDVYDANDVLPVSRSAIRRGLSNPEASQCITAWKIPGQPQTGDQ